MQDVQKVLETLDIEEGMWSCIGSSGHTSSDAPSGEDDGEQDDLHGHSAPMSFGRSRL